MIGEIALPVRKYQSVPDLTIGVNPANTAFLLVDCDESSVNRQIVESNIHPALQAARSLGLKVAYLYNAIQGVGGDQDVTTKIHGLAYLENSWNPLTPTFNPFIEPLEGEAVIPKSHKDGFNGTVLDYYLKTWNIDTIIAVGFHLKSCLFHTCLAARHHNYRVVMLRDCTDSNEFPDTVDPANPEGGWFRFVFMRLYETDIGYTSTSTSFIQAAAKS
ncbi:isochorismatase family protein [Paenibacillus silvisoli]|uniref:isochorismatase family protein n=1 Tax=Paenibacillus silvisoli TaxID=3110539 RepID=UPI002805B430|nr:isochorismatase family protein [Paenibacillus silvisoli]